MVKVRVRVRVNLVAFELVFPLLFLYHSGVVRGSSRGLLPLVGDHFLSLLEHNLGLQLRLHRGYG